MRSLSTIIIAATFFACSHQTPTKTPETARAVAPGPCCRDTVAMPIEDPALNADKADDVAPATAPGLSRLADSATPKLNPTADGTNALWHPNERLLYLIPPGWEDDAGVTGPGLANVAFTAGRGAAIRVSLEPTVATTPQAACQRTADDIKSDGGTLIGAVTVANNGDLVSFRWQQGTQAGRVSCRRLTPPRPDLMVVSRGTWPKADAAYASRSFDSITGSLEVR